MGVDTGMGASVAFGTTGFTANWKSINGQTQREIIDKTHLGSTSAREAIQAKMKNPGTLEMEIQLDPGMTTAIPMTTTAETVTVTFPLMSGQTTAASLSSSGFVTGYKAHVEGGQMMTANLTVQLTGKPTWTDSN